MFALGFAFFCISFIAERSCLKLIIPQDIVLHKSLYPVTTEDCFDGSTSSSTLSACYTILLQIIRGQGWLFSLEVRSLVQGNACHTACTQGILGT